MYVADRRKQAQPISNVSKSRPNLLKTLPHAYSTSTTVTALGVHRLAYSLVVADALISTFSYSPHCRQIKLAPSHFKPPTNPLKSINFSHPQLQYHEHSYSS